MIPFRMSKTGWRVVETAIGGWGPTLRLVMIIMAATWFLGVLLLGAGLAGEWLRAAVASLSAPAQ